MKHRKHSLNRIIHPTINRQNFYRLFTLLAMKKLTLINGSVEETGGVFEDLDAIRDLQAAAAKPDIYLTDDNAVKDTAANHELGNVSSETRKS